MWSAWWTRPTFAMHDLRSVKPDGQMRLSEVVVARQPNPFKKCVAHTYNDALELHFSASGEEEILPVCPERSRK